MAKYLYTTRDCSKHHLINVDPRRRHEDDEILDPDNIDIYDDFYNGQYTASNIEEEFLVF
jgi:hypothetical protein